MRPTSYKKGPDVGSKSECTVYRYRKLLTGQSKLGSFGFEVEETKWKPVMREKSETPDAMNVEMGHSTSHTDPTSIPLRVPQIREETATPPPLTFDDNPPQPAVPMVPIHVESVTPAPLSFDSDSDGPVVVPSKRPLDDHNGEAGEACQSPGLSFPPNGPTELDDSEPWEEVVHETMTGSSLADIRGWEPLRDQIKKDLKKRHSSLPLSHINQLMILRNFATLRIKGHSRMSSSHQIAQQWHEKSDGTILHFARRVRALARHYQIFEQLPPECRGGSKNARSLLKDEAARQTALSWLSEQEVGSITPQKFMEALNGVILPSLGIATKKPLCERTARRWLVKLGWQRTRVKKGVYMDGHERPDVVKYREEIFLPAMKQFERRMIRYEPKGEELVRIDPVLEPGERVLIPEFHDESCFQQNDHQSSLWYESPKIFFNPC